MKIGKDDICTLAYVPLHYGKDYLKYVLESIRPFVEDILILYTKTPSYGHTSNLQNPDTEEELRAICGKFSCIWMDVTGTSREGTHRQMAYDWAKKQINSKNGRNYDLVFAVDADEIWNPEKVPEALHAAYNSGYHHHCISGNNWWHFWKGFKEVNTDGFYPNRITNLNNYVTNQTIIDKGEIYHMGYAISEEAMRYKIGCHGHKSEIENSWLTDKWINYERGVTTHLHPASRDIWIETKDFEGDLPTFLKDHPYANVEG